MDEKTNRVSFDYNKPEKEEQIRISREFTEKMEQRRTVREISNEPVPDEILFDLIKTAGTAPSGANKQPWFFCIVKDDEIKSRIRKASEYHEEVNYKKKYSKKWQKDLEFLEISHKKEFLTSAPALIVAFKQRYSYEHGQKSKHYYISESSGIALGLLIAAIQNAGLVTVPYTPMPRTFLNEILDRPSYESALMVLPVGYPKPGATVPDKRRKGLDEIMEVY